MGVQFNKPCLGCGSLIKGSSYCNQCRPVRQRTTENANKKAFLYGGTYRARAKQIKQTATHCHLCGKEFLPGDPIEADHLFPEMGNESPLAPAHRQCNRERGNKPV